MRDFIYSIIFGCWWKHEWVAIGDPDPAVTPDGKILLQCGKCFDNLDAETYRTWTKRKYGE